MKRLKEFLVDCIIDVMRKNEGKRVILKNGRTLTCISENRTQRYAVGKGKEGKFISIKSLYDYLNGKKVESYCVLENDSKISLYTDDVKSLNFIKMPTEKDYDKYVEDEKKSREQQYIKTDMELWTKRLNDRINDGELITGYVLKDSTCGRHKDVILDLVTNEGEATLHMGAENEEHLKMILDLVTPLITEKTEDREDNTDDDINDSEIFYIKTTDGYEEVEGVRIDNKYGLELFCHEIALGNFRLSHIPTGIAVNDTATCHKDELLNKIDDLVARNGLDKLKKAFNNAIIKHGYVPNYRLNDGKNEGEIVMDKDEDVLSDVKEQLCKEYNIQKIGLSVCKSPYEDSFRLYISEMVGKTVKEISIKYENGQFNIYFIYDDREYIVLKSIDEVTRLIVKEFDLSPVYTDDDKKDIEGIRTFLEEVKTFSKDTKSTLQGQVYCRQRCYYRLEKYNGDDFVIECKLYTNDDNLYTSKISDMNDDNNISIFEYRGAFNKGFKKLLEFFNKHHKVYNRFIGLNDGKKDISTLMGSLMSKLESSGELRCFMDSDTLTGIIQQSAESKTYIKHSKNDGCFYIDRDDKTINLSLIQLIRNKLKQYGIDFEVIKLNGVKHFKIDLNEGNLSIL